MFFFQIKGTPIHGEESGPPSLPPPLSSGRLAISRRWLHSPSVNEGRGPASGKRRREGVRERGRGRKTLKQAVVIAIPTSKSQPRQMDGRLGGGRRGYYSLPPSLLLCCVCLRLHPFCCLNCSPSLPSRSVHVALRGRFQKICGRRRHTTLGVTVQLSDSLVSSSG